MSNQPHTPNVSDFREDFVTACVQSRWLSSDRARQYFDRELAAIEAAAEQRGMRLAQEAIAGDQTVERAHHRVGDILSTAQVLHVIDQAIKNRADQMEGDE